MTHNEISRIIVDTVVEVHRTIGPGLLESAYLAIMVHELEARGLHVAKEVPVPIHWKNVTLDVGFRADIIVENAVIIELKSVEKTAPVHKKQLLTYLRMADKRLGLLINFGEELGMNGITRVVNGLKE